MLTISRKIDHSLVLRHRDFDTRFTPTVLTLTAATHFGVCLSVTCGDCWFTASIDAHASLIIKIGPETYATIYYRGRNSGGQHKLAIDTASCIDVSRRDDVDPSIDDMMSMTPSDGSTASRSGASRTPTFASKDACSVGASDRAGRGWSANVQLPTSNVQRPSEESEVA